MKEISERLNRQILKSLLHGDVSARSMVNEEVLRYVDVVLTENDQIACLLFMNDHLDDHETRVHYTVCGAPRNIRRCFVLLPRSARYGG